MQAGNTEIDRMLAKLAYPGAPEPGGAAGIAPPGALGMQFGAPPSPQVASPAGKQQLINAMTAKAGGQLQGAGPVGSGIGGAVQGASLAGMLTGKSPMAGLKDAGGNIIDKLNPNSLQNRMADINGMSSDAAGAKASTLADKISGDAAFGPGNPGPFADAAPAMPQVADSAAGMASAGDAAGQLGMDGSQALVKQLLSGGGGTLAEGAAAPALEGLGTAGSAADLAALMGTAGTVGAGADIAGSMAGIWELAPLMAAFL